MFDRMMQHVENQHLEYDPAAAAQSGEDDEDEMVMYSKCIHGASLMHYGYISLPPPTHCSKFFINSFTNNQHNG